MCNANTDFAEVPAIIPGGENEEDREKLVREATEAPGSEDERDGGELDDEDVEAVLRPVRPSKKKVLTAFAGFVAFFVLLLVAICWFFGIGAFSATKRQPVDRTSKSDSSSAAPVTEEEKLKMALNMVVEKKPSGTSGDAKNDTESAVTIPVQNNAIPTGSVTLPGEHSSDTLASLRSKEAKTDQNSPSTPTLDLKNSVDQDKSPANKSRSDGEIAPPGRSIFFGRKLMQDISQSTAPAPLKPSSNEIQNKSSLPARIPFGTLLPVRLIGSLYTFRNSSGFVRMELTRGIEGTGYSYPTGTIIVGTLRGSEYKRAFVSITGLIDPNSGRLVKIGGEVLGKDGASGLLGQQRKVTSVWSRTLAGLRDIGTAALGAAGNWRSGGTVVISDSAQKASGSISELVGGKKQSNEFVEVSAGTNGYVLVTDLPKEESPVINSNTNTVTGLTDDELADLFSSGSTEKLQAAMPRMTPEFQRLAEQTLESLENK
jgi:hypothetical protein